MSAPARNDGSAKVTAVAGGGGCGGLIVLLANTYLTAPWQDAVIYLAPTIGIVAGGVFAIAEIKVKAWSQDRSIRAELAKASSALQQIEKDPNATEDHRAQARAEVESLRILALQRHNRRVRKVIDGP